MLLDRELSEISNPERFCRLLSLRDKIFHRVDRVLKSYVAHTSGAQSVLTLGNGWHSVSCFSSTEYRRPRKRTIGVLNGKLYWDDFPHFKFGGTEPEVGLTPEQINFLMGISPGERRPIDGRIRQLVFSRYDGKCARCGSTEDLELHHRRPVIHGGTNDPANLVPLCKGCHTRHCGEFTERIWPDLERIFLESDLIRSESRTKMRL